MQRHGCYGRPAFQLRMCQTLRPSHATSCNVQTRRRFGLIPTRASALVRPSAVWSARWADHRPGRDPQATRPGCVAPLGRRHPFVLAARLGGRRCGRPAIARRGAPAEAAVARVAPRFRSRRALRWAMEHLQVQWPIDLMLQSGAMQQIAEQSYFHQQGMRV